MLDSVVDASALSPQAAGYVPTAYHAGAAALPTAPRFRFQVRPPFGAVLDLCCCPPASEHTAQLRLRLWQPTSPPCSPPHTPTPPQAADRARLLHSSRRAACALRGRCQLGVAELCGQRRDAGGQPGHGAGGAAALALQGGHRSSALAATNEGRGERCQARHEQRRPPASRGAARRRARAQVSSSRLRCGSAAAAAAPQRAQDGIRQRHRTVLESCHGHPLAVGRHGAADGARTSGGRAAALNGAFRRRAAQGCAGAGGRRRRGPAIISG